MYNNDETNEQPKYMKSNYKPGWLSQIDQITCTIRGRMKELKKITEAYDEILTDTENALVTAFTDQIESLCTKFIKEVYNINPDWEIILNPEREWWLEKNKDNSKK